MSNTGKSDIIKIDKQITEVIQELQFLTIKLSHLNNAKSRLANPPVSVPHQSKYQKSSSDCGFQIGDTAIILNSYSNVPRGTIGRITSITQKQATLQTSAGEFHTQSKHNLKNANINGYNKKNNNNKNYL